MALFIRADADTNMGTGHVMRCLALGQAWCDVGGEVVFATACTNPTLLNRLRAEGFAVRGAEELGNAPDRNTWLVLDGYHFDPAYQLQLRQTGWRILAIDDMAHLPHYYADVLLNQNVGADRCCYPREPYTRLLLGPSYALLRREFERLPGWRRQMPHVASKLLVTLGGSDPNRITLRVVEAIRSASVTGMEAVVVAGAECKETAELRDACEAGVRLEMSVADMAPLMAWADMGIAGAGSTCWELAHLGLPAIVIVAADNQRNIAEGLVEQGCALSLGWHADVTAVEIAAAIHDLAFDRQRRSTFSAQSSALVDGLGAKRVVDFLRN